MLLEALLQPREIVEHVIEVGVRLARRAGVGAQLHVFLDRQLHEGTAPVGNVGNTKPHDVLRGEAIDATVVKRDLTLRLSQAADGAQRCRLAGAVGSQQSGHAALANREINAMQVPFRLAILGVEALRLEQPGHSVLPSDKMNGKPSDRDHADHPGLSMT